MNVPVLSRRLASLGPERAVEGADGPVPEIQGQIEDWDAFVRRVGQDPACLVGPQLVQEGVEVPVPQLLVDDASNAVLRDAEFLGKPSDRQALLLVELLTAHGAEEPVSKPRV